MNKKIYIDYYKNYWTFTFKKNMDAVSFVKIWFLVTAFVIAFEFSKPKSNFTKYYGNI